MVNLPYTGPPVLPEEPKYTPEDLAWIRTIPQAHNPSQYNGSERELEPPECHLHGGPNPRASQVLARGLGLCQETSAENSPTTVEMALHCDSEHPYCTQGGQHRCMGPSHPHPGSRPICHQGLCTALGKECCFYADHSEIVKESMTLELGGLQKCRHEREQAQSWYESMFNWFPWLNTLISAIAGPLILLLLDLTITTQRRSHSWGTSLGATSATLAPCCGSWLASVKARGWTLDGVCASAEAGPFTPIQMR
ncbi:uncharacterized protein LOC128579523 [Nycticebus coucang]|uniref:uncharacterized protein LOC128579523 n=1 Tax=Nycticebus coucang TaxID=9470 RepID=UPI00234CDC5D|nr:uncharacterized protein LOC128579523 [Nycticebus coucang]